MLRRLAMPSCFKGPLDKALHSGGLVVQEGPAEDLET